MSAQSAGYLGFVGLPVEPDQGVLALLPLFVGSCRFDKKASPIFQYRNLRTFQQEFFIARISLHFVAQSAAYNTIHPYVPYLIVLAIQVAGLAIEWMPRNRLLTIVAQRLLCESEKFFVCDFDGKTTVSSYSNERIIGIFKRSPASTFGGSIFLIAPATVGIIATQITGFNWHFVAARTTTPPHNRFSFIGKTAENRKTPVGFASPILEFWKGSLLLIVGAVFQSPFTLQAATTFSLFGTEGISQYGQFITARAAALPDYFGCLSEWSLENSVW